MILDLFQLVYVAGVFFCWFLYSLGLFLGLAEDCIRSDQLAIKRNNQMPLLIQTRASYEKLLTEYKELYDHRHTHTEVQKEKYRILEKHLLAYQNRKEP